MDTTEIELAMDELLRSAIDARGRHTTQDKSRPEVFKLSDLSELEMSPIGDLIEAPTFAACRRGLRTIGEYLAADEQAAQGMYDLLHRVAAMGGRNEDRRISIINRAWDGLKLAGGGVWLA